MDASEILSKRLSAKEVFCPKQMKNSFFQSQMDEKNVGGDQELRTSTLIREHPIRGEDQRFFLGESEGSLPPLQDSLPDASEATNDFWSMSGNFIYHHHVEPRVKLYSPSAWASQCASCPSVENELSSAGVLFQTFRCSILCQRV